MMVIALLHHQEHGNISSKNVVGVRLGAELPVVVGFGISERKHVEVRPGPRPSSHRNTLNGELRNEITWKNGEIQDV